MKSLARVGCAMALCLASSCGGSSSSTSGADDTSAIDGSWDITAAGSGSIGPSEMTVSGGTASGFIASTREGKADLSSPQCTVVKDRAEFTIAAQGDVLSGTASSVSEWSGSSCPVARTKTTPISGKRTRSAAPTDTALDGDWEVTFGDEAPFIVTIAGLTAEVTDKAEKERGGASTPSATVAIAGGIATVTADREQFSFAARKR